MNKKYTKDKDCVVRCPCPICGSDIVAKEIACGRGYSISFLEKRQGWSYVPEISNIEVNTYSEGRVGERVYRPECSNKTCPFRWGKTYETPEAALEASSKRWDGWISVEERLPESGSGLLLLVYEDDFFSLSELCHSFGWFSDGKFSPYDEDAYWVHDNVTHWQLMPQLPDVA